MYDNLDLFYLKEMRDARENARRPHCCICGEPIWQDKALRIDRGLMCDSCIEENQEWIEDEEDE